MNFMKLKTTELKEPYAETALTKTIEQYNKFWFLCCCPNIWVKKPDLPEIFVKIYRKLTILIHIVMLIFSASATLSYVTQKNLTPNQKSDRLSYAASTLIITVLYHFVVIYYTDDIRELLYKLVVLLKKDHNNELAEKEMIAQSKRFNTIFFTPCVCNLVLVGLFRCYRSIVSDETFITCITAWPGIDDRSPIAGITRVIVYLVWLTHVIRNMGVFVIIHTLLLCLSQQYKNLQSYFESLNEIFYEPLSQEEKEVKYDAMFKKGIEHHALTLWCVDETQRIFQLTFSSHVLLWCGLIISIFPEVMNNETHSLSVLASNAPRVTAALVGLGYFMWPAGDITINASELPNFMYGSGWNNCHKNFSRTRKLLLLALMQAQKPIELKAFGQFTYSYETYVAIVKMSYSLFSVMY